MRGARWVVAGTVLAASLAVVPLAEASLLRALWPAVVALVTIVLLQRAALGLGCGVLAGALLLVGGDLASVPRMVLQGHVFPAMQGPWRIGAIVFTLLLGAFAGVLERSGGFEALLGRLLAHGRDAGRRLLGGVYLVGLLCFFDGLASSLLSGRLARPLVDRAGISRERLAWVVDATGSPVACVAFISTWIATQLSLIDQGLKQAPFAVDPYAMFFLSLPANAYCWLTLGLVPLAIWWGYQPRAMRRYQACAPEVNEPVMPALPSPRVVLIPLAVLVLGILGGFPLLSGEPVDVLAAAGWRQAFSGDAGPYALVFGSLAGLVAAFLAFPSGRRHEAVEAAVLGAGTLLPALLVLILAWSLGSMFEALGAAGHLGGLLASAAPVAWLPLAVFACGCAMAFCTGSSWGTMGLLMPLALPATLVAGQTAGLAAGETQALAAMVIGAVFGGATFGDHCSPFSDTTIVSALASGCTPTDHVISQLPLAGLAAGAATAAYALMAAGLPSHLSTGLAGLGLAAVVWRLRDRDGGSAFQEAVVPAAPASEASRERST